MQLPTYNKAYAIMRASKIMLPLTLLFGYLVFRFPNPEIKYTCITIFLLSAIFSVIFLRKHFIKKVTLQEENLEVYHLNKIIQIPFDNITDIASGLSPYIEFRAKLTMMYRLDLNKKYQFGSKLYFKFDKQVDQNIDPKAISIIRDKINTPNRL